MSTRSSTSPSACVFERALWAALLLACASCAGALEDVDAFAPPPPDAGEVLDSGTPTDAGSNDAGPSDAGYSDAGAASDAGSPPDAGTADAGCNALTTIIAPTCATALCHSSGTQQGSLDLQSSGLPERLIGQQAAGGPGFIINAQSPDQSVLYTKTLAPPPYGARMPLLGNALSAEQLACLKSWIHQAVGVP